MSNPSDPHRHHGDDLPRDTDAFEDTEFSMGTKEANDAAGTPSGSSGNLEGAEGHDGYDGYDAEVDSSGDTHGNTAASEGDREIIDAESTEVTEAAEATEAADTSGEPLGSARDPEVTGIIPIVNDDRISEHEQKLNERNESSDTTVLPVAGAGASAADGDAASAPAPAAGGGGDSDGPPPGNDTRPWFARFPTWGWILVIGLGLSVIGAATAVALMRTGDGEERHSPYSSVVPNYPRPEAWDSNNPIPSAQPDNSAGTDYYYEPEYNEPEEYTPYTPEESEEATPSSQAPTPSEQNPGNSGNSGNNGGNSGNSGNGGNNSGNNGGGNQTTPGGGTGGEGNGGGNNGGGNGNNGGTGGGTEDGGGNTGPDTGDGDGAAEE